MKPMKIMCQKPRFVSPLASLGESWEVQEELDSFTCCVCGGVGGGGGPCFNHLDDLRHHLLKEKCRDDVMNTN